MTSNWRLIPLVVCFGAVLGFAMRVSSTGPVKAAGSAPIFSDGFENAQTIQDLFPADNSRWSNMQQEPRGNLVSLSTEHVLAGSQSLKMYAQPYNGINASKADIAKEGLSFPRGSEVWTEMWVYLVGGGSAANVFMWDLEAPDTCTSALACPRPGTGRICNSPGRRLYLTGPTPSPSPSWIKSDLGKWCIPQEFTQPSGHEVFFPTDQWVRLRVYMRMSELSDGVMKVWQDGSLIIDAIGITLPRQDSVYTRLQNGITANGNTTYPRTMYLDNVSVWNQPPNW